MSNIVPSWGYALMIAGLVIFIGLIAFYVKRNHGFKRPLFASPYIIWIVIFTVVPCLIVAYYSFTRTVGRKANDDEITKVTREYTITIDPAKVTVIAEDKCMQAGSEMPRLTVIVDGCSFASKQTVSSIAKKYVPHCKAGDVPGEYEICFDQSYVKENDYEITFVSGKMTVYPAGSDAVLCVNSYEKTYDGQELKTTATCSINDALIEYSSDQGATWSETAPSIIDAGHRDILVRATCNDKAVISEKKYTDYKDFTDHYLTESDGNTDTDSVTEYSIDQGVTWSETRPAAIDAGESEILVRKVRISNDVVAQECYTLSVKPAEARILVLNQAYIAGNSPYELNEAKDAKCLGLTNREKSDNVIDFKLDTNPGQKPGDYEITALFEEDQGNYHVTCDKGVLTLTENYEIKIASTDLEQTYNGKPIVPTDFAFLNVSDQELVQTVLKLNEETGEYKEISGDKNIKESGTYKVINTAVSNAVTVTEFTFDNFISFLDSNFNAREDMKRINADNASIDLGKLEQRGNGNLVIFGRSLWMAFLCTLICLLVGYPAAYIMADREFRLGSTIIILFIVPMWMNFLLRTIAMMAILDDDGVINTILQWIGLPKAKLMYNSGAVLLGMVYNFLPFMVFPIYNVLNKMDVKLSEAAMDLGCDKIQTFERVTLPLSIPGIVSGITMVFMPAVTTFYISGLLGGGNYTMFGDLIESKFISGSLSTWNEGSALSLIMMVLILISIGLLRKADPKGEGGAV